MQGKCSRGCGGAYFQGGTLRGIAIWTCWRCGHELYDAVPGKSNEHIPPKAGDGLHQWEYIRRLAHSHGHPQETVKIKVVYLVISKQGHRSYAVAQAISGFPFWRWSWRNERKWTPLALVFREELGITLRGVTECLGRQQRTKEASPDAELLSVPRESAAKYTFSPLTTTPPRSSVATCSKL